ncbi:hypothetical protein [Salinisphaera dokdonensis]
MSEDATGQAPVPVPAAEVAVVEALPQPVATARSEESVPRDLVAQTRYKATLAVDKSLSHPGPAGELRVWIGHESQSADVPAHMVSDDAVMPALGDWSVVTPFAPDFDVEPAHSECVKVHPSGSELQFAIVPKASGTFPVGARVMLYDNAQCKGAGISKAARTLRVTVEVNQRSVIVGHLLQVWAVVWDNILKFIGGALAILVAWLLARMRRRSGQSE